MTGMSGLGNSPSIEKSLPRKNLPFARTIADAESKLAMPCLFLPIMDIDLNLGTLSGVASQSAAIQ
jgi:hypothetical protein